MSNTICLHDINRIPLIGVNRREFTMKCLHNSLIYDVEKARVSRTTLSPIYRYSNNLGGTWIEQSTNTSRYVQHSPRF